MNNKKKSIKNEKKTPKGEITEIKKSRKKEQD